MFIAEVIDELDYIDIDDDDEVLDIQVQRHLLIDDECDELIVIDVLLTYVVCMQKIVDDDDEHYQIGVNIDMHETDDDD